MNRLLRICIGWKAACGKVADCEQHESVCFSGKAIVTYWPGFNEFVDDVVTGPEI